MASYQQGQPITIFDSFSKFGIPTDPTQIVYTIQAPDGTVTTYTFPGAVEITNTGVGDYQLALAPPALPGLYQYDVDATGAVEASRAASFSVIANVSSPTDLDWAVVGPCSPWVDSQDIWDCCGRPMTTIGEGSSATECPVDMTPFAMEASQLLYELSVRQFAGVCERTVRPCGQPWCGLQFLSRGHIVWDGYGWGGWWNGSYNQVCGCQPLSRVHLSGYPVREIMEVKIDGAVVDPTTYRLDERRWLTRVRDPLDPDVVLLWPHCQHLDADDSQEGTFSVTYRYGQDPPLIGVHAAAQLGCEIYKSCQGSSDCLLPSGITRITRQGITIDRAAFVSWSFQRGQRSQLRGWRTGIPLVDAFLGAYSPNGNNRRPAVWSPDHRMRYARSVGQ